MVFRKKILNSLKLAISTVIPTSVIFSNISLQNLSIQKSDEETKDALNFIPFDDYYKKGYFDVDTSNNAFVLKGFNLDQNTKKEIQADIDANEYNALFIPDYVTSISSSLESFNVGAFQFAFSSHTSESQYVSNKITSIIFDSSSVCSSLGKHCFEYCDSVNFISLPKSINELGDYCFSSCTSLSTILLPESLKVIPWYCFGCYTTETQANDLTICIPEGVETIDRAAFEGRNINSITFPTTLKAINDSAFKKSTVLSMSFLSYDDDKIKSLSIDSSWATEIKPYDTQTNKIKVFLPKDKSASYTAVNNFQFTNQEINNGLIYTNAYIDNPVFNFEVPKNNFQNKLNDVESSLRFKLFPYQDIYGNYMDSTAEYNFSCESTNPGVVTPNPSKDNILQGKLNVSYKKNGSSRTQISEVCNKLNSPLNFLNCFVKTSVDSLYFKDTQFNSYFLESTDSPITTPAINDDVYDFYGNKVSTDIKFSIVNNNQQTYTLPDWITLNETTGSLKISPNADSESIPDIKIKVEQTTTGLIGYSDQFSIVIQDDTPAPKPTELIITYDFFTIFANPGDSISTPSLTTYVTTDTHEPVTSGLNFVLSRKLPDGLSFDSATGQITGTLTEQSESCYDTSIFVSAKVDSETLQGESRLFSIVVQDSPVQPTKLLINENIRTIYTKPNQLIRTSSLKESVTTDTSAPVTDGLNFSCDNLPAGFSIDNSTGVISCASVPADTQDTIDLQVHVSATVGSATLEGNSNYFSIIINTDIEPTKLIIDNDFLTMYVNEGQVVSTVDLTNSVVTDYWSPVTTSLTFSCDSTLPSGLNFDSQTGKISGTIATGAISCLNIRIKVQADVDGKTLSGYSNYFSIIVSGTPVAPTKLLFTEKMYNVSTFTGRAVTIDQDLENNIVTDTGLKINTQEHKLTFTLNGELPLGLSFDKATGKITGRIQLGATSSKELTITASANYDGINLTGESNSFYIYVNEKPISPSSLTVEYHLDDYYVNTNEEITTPSLVHYIYTNLHDKVSTNLKFFVSALLPSGLEIDENSGSIHGKVDQETIGPERFKLEIYVETTINGKLLQGKTNTFTIILNNDRAIKWNNVALIIIGLMLLPICVAVIDTSISVAFKALVSKIKNRKSKTKSRKKAKSKSKRKSKTKSKRKSKRKIKTKSKRK